MTTYTESRAVREIRETKETILYFMRLGIAPTVEGLAHFFEGRMKNHIAILEDFGWLTIENGVIIFAGNFRW